MPRQQRPRSILAQFRVRVSKNHGVKFMLWSAGIVTVLSLAITTFTPAYVVIEPMLPAQRYHYREAIEPLKLAQTQQNLAIDRLIGTQLKQQLYEVKKDPAYNRSVVIQERAKTIETEIKDTDRRIEENERRVRK